MRSDEIVIREVALRDGLQLVPQVIPTSLKCRWIDEADNCGLQEMEVTSFVPPRLYPQFADAREVVAHSRGAIGRTSVLAPNLHAVRRALDAGAEKINFAISGTESFNRTNLRRSILESLAEFPEARDLIAESGQSVQLAAVISTAFFCPFEGPVPAHSVQSIVEAIHRLGICEIVLADTTGQANPRAVAGLVRQLFRELPDLGLGIHLHDTLGLAMANAFAALEAGVRMFDTALAGLGGCPNSPGASGNLSTEDFAFALERSGVSTGLDMPRLVALANSLATHCAEAPRHSHLLESGVSSLLTREFAS